ncbi:potassium voltage-gated channel subfamily G member 4 [Anolis carolinensis]|uniref:Potassium voltage-gated channel modifier subfamily G member 4 n=1 Tax=Anolis carolinensis TaxID=28377 RepID=H9GDE1_ANOCA|nr:PREDICTED: potassium voltage-gated channel subfamily G member 4 [Anolis carolinensis]XP_016853978.1 PREDICTED: potassium voltage-gated channel subfamily G member 4 [Anolis carolinensis]XP_016853979.1 PREDICTED: potassium voltage-gated channel subfamily G member 4 [Anolis carolinensis]XP_016853980.1 PREDICTED: potassium voltage-gated channel subfamily G member 4 [Anolis carolinensis]XP_016853981.1 PREDICTED: potassium voltage-gated channel subfamily G member 4 [Anolis carolinensis]|eukprot:XP_008121419.1 PREDICTED: potassium voltage-gated channel subfamily G member 4 [Anolis carolinensis]
MPILSGGSEHDFSYASCTSLNHLIPISVVETPPAKGLHYQRAKKVCRPDQLRSADLRSEIVVNVGGIKYLLPWSTLDEFPSSRLSKLRFCSGYEEIIQLCDDYDEDSHEFFFDRSPSAFGAIASFLAAGKLILLRDMCALSFREELNYWGIEESSLENCCFRKLFQKVEELAEQHREEEMEMNKVMSCILEEETRTFMSRLRDMVENPQSGLPGKIFACLSILFVATTTISLCVSTMPDLREAEDRGECSQKCYYIFIVETICVAWFSLEFCLRFIQAKSKCQFFKGPLNIIDFMAISPYYASLIVLDDETAEGEEKPSGNSYLEKVGLVLRVLRALRILYVMRLARHSLGLQTLGLTVRRSAREFGLLLLFLGVSVTLFSPLVYLAENESGKILEFTSIPASYWWAIISMTTVGYGDMVPRSVPGQMVALSSILSGILIMSFPATSIFHTFSHSYSELRKEQERLQSRIRRMRNINTSGESDTLNESDSGGFLPDPSGSPIRVILPG